MPISTDQPFILDLHTNSNEVVNMTEFAIPDNAVTNMDFVIVARATSTGAGTKFTVSAVASRANGGVPVVNVAKGTQIGSSTLGAANVTVIAGAGFSVIVQVNGVTGIPMDWAIQGVNRSLYA